MTLHEIIEKYNVLGVLEKRASTEEKDERVIYNREIDKWNKPLFDIFGPPLKPQGSRPSNDDLTLTEEHGGIWIDQTLFRKEFDNAVVIAMLWP